MEFSSPSLWNHNACLVLSCKMGLIWSWEPATFCLVSEMENLVYLVAQNPSELCFCQITCPTMCTTWEPSERKPAEYFCSILFNSVLVVLEWKSLNVIWRRRGIERHRLEEKWLISCGDDKNFEWTVLAVMHTFSRCKTKAISALVLNSSWCYMWTFQGSSSSQ